MYFWVELVIFEFIQVVGKMKKILFPFLLVVTFSFAQCPESLHNFTVIKINGDTLPLSSLAGKKVMVVNTASY